MKLTVQEKLLKEAAILEELWKNDPLLKKQKVVKKKIRKGRSFRMMPTFVLS